MKRKKTQLIVLGGGPGGYTAAFQAADCGLDVVLVDEAPSLGGVCLNHGCIPSKALIQTTAFLDSTPELKHRGIHYDAPRINLRQLNDWKGQVVADLGKGLEAQAQKRHVKLIRGRGTFEEVNLLRVEEAEGQSYFEFEHAIIATGSKASLPSLFDLGNPRVMTSRAALELQSIPQKLLIIGGGYIGLELGTVYARLGSEVTLVEAMEALLPGADADLVAPVAKRAKELFHKVKTETEVKHLATSGEQIEAGFSGEDATAKELFDAVLVAVGRTPNSKGLGLDELGVETDSSGFIEVDERGQTSNERVFAIGDVCREPMLAHKAIKEAKAAVKGILGERSSATDFYVPAIVFTDPEVAWVGLTQAKAEAEKIDHVISTFSWKASGRARSHGRTDGLTKLIIDPKSERLLGVGVCGHGATDLIVEGTLALEMGASVGDLAEIIHPHPTLSETFQGAAEAFFHR